jgi:hypothetical protein
MVTDSRDTSVSDRLILTHSTASQLIKRFLRSGPGQSLRKIWADYNEIVEECWLSKDGAELMAEFGWLERMPEYISRQKLIH